MPSSSDDIEFDRAYVAAFGLLGFVRLAWNHVNPGIPFVDGWHIREISNHLEAVSTHDERGIPYCRNLVINVPPGASKSTITSVCWPAFVWGPGGMPDKKFMFFSFDPTLVSKHGRQCKELIESEWFQERWPVHILDRAETDFRTSKNGFRYGSSIRGGGTGRHADIIVVDDPIKPALTQGVAAVTRGELDYVKGWWSGTMATRNANPKTTARVIIMQRLHEDDLAGVCLASTNKRPSKYTHLCLPMQFEVARACKTPFGCDRRTVEGEYLCPDRWGPAELQDLVDSLGIFHDAQVQQRPSSAAGQIFKRAWLRFYDNLPVQIDEWACSWDMTFKDTKGADFVCGQVWARAGADFYLVERVYERLNFPNTLTAFQAQLRRWPQIGPKLIEDKANGPAIIATLERKIPGLVAVNPQGGKVARANAISYMHRAGNVHYPRAYEHETSNTAHVPNMLGFPFARHDDSVDAETQMLTYWEAQKNTLFETFERLRQEQRT